MILWDIGDDFNYLPTIDKCISIVYTYVLYCIDMYHIVFIMHFTVVARPCS